jgi:hypothetical protein
MFYLVQATFGEYSDAYHVNYNLFDNKAAAELQVKHLEERYPDASFYIAKFDVVLSTFTEPIKTNYVKYNISLDTQTSKLEVRKQFLVNYDYEELPRVNAFDHKTIFDSYFSHVLTNSVMNHQEVNVLMTEWLLDDGTLTDPIPSFNVKEFQDFKDDGNYYNYICGNPKNGHMLSRFTRFDKKQEVVLVKNKLYECFDIENDSKFTFEITDIQMLTRIAKKSGRPVISYNYVFSNSLADVFNKTTGGYLIREV